MKPPYDITPEILNLIASASEKLGEINASHLYRPSPQLRRENRIRTVQSSVAIEGNSLSLDQVTAIFDGKRSPALRQIFLKLKTRLNFIIGFLSLILILYLHF